MTVRSIQALDLHGFALKEFLDFVRKEDPSWIEGALVRRSDDGQHRSGVVDGKLWVELLMSENSAEALVRVLARAEFFDESESSAVLSLRRALRQGGVTGD